MNCQWEVSGNNGFDHFIHGVYLSHKTGIIKIGKYLVIQLQAYVVV